jgi:hypothetical protein
LQRFFPDEAKRLNARLEEEYNERYENLKRLAEEKRPAEAAEESE